MKKFFDLTLSTEPMDRSKDLHYLLQLLTQNIYESKDFHVPTIVGLKEQLVIDEPLFMMQRDVVQFTSSDYRVREYIVACLKSEALAYTTEECRQNAAFQLAFCCMTGYGCPKDDETAHSWVKRSGKSL
ncbi:hypothetical protein ABVK25_006606 [Lepraria finkii]|uniref:Uncharacterized protein n=1 Tax=Lepraria finkii TaxID=1340010 RepID=A0ABR4B7Y7_9LECA